MFFAENSSYLGTVQNLLYYMAGAKCNRATTFLEHAQKVKISNVYKAVTFSAAQDDIGGKSCSF